MTGHFGNGSSGRFLLLTLLTFFGLVRVDACNWWKQKETAAENERELLEACSQGNTDLVRSLLLNENVDLNAKYDIQKHGQTANIDTIWDNGNTCLMLAARYDKAETVEMLIREYQPNINEQTDERGWTALHNAAAYDNIAVARILCEDGKANLELKSNNQLAALMFGGLDIARTFLEGGSGKSMTGVFGTPGATPLMLAAQEGKYEMIEYLLERGANINETNSNGMTAVQLAKRQDIKKLFQKHGAVVLDDTKQKELLEACSQGNTELARTLLLTEQVDVNAKFDLRNHRDPTGIDPIWDTGNTCLMLAARYNKAETVEMLIREFKPNVDEQTDERGWTALHNAAVYGNIAVARILCEDGKANLELKSNNQLAALLFGGLDIARTLLEGGSGRGMTGVFGSPGATPLMLAAQEGKYEMVEYLLKQGAKINERDNVGNTALVLARTAEIKELLEQHGATL